MQPDTYRGGPRLLIDIAGRHARFGLEYAPGSIEAVRTIACADYARLEDAVRSYLTRHADAMARHAVISVAAPGEDDTVQAGGWTFSREAARRALGLATLLVVHDFEAYAMAVPRLSGASAALTRHLVASSMNTDLEAPHAFP